MRHLDCRRSSSNLGFPTKLLDVVFTPSFSSHVNTTMMEDSSGQRRKHVELVCSSCGSKFWRPSNRRTAPRVFCSNKCKGAAQITSTPQPCGQCGEPVTRNPREIVKSKSGSVFCDYKCAAGHRISLGVAAGSDHPNWNGGKASYRQRALRHYGSSCHAPGCPVTAAGIDIPEIMLDVDHIDNNRRHNQIENLQVICVWCHALKTRT